LGHTPETGGAVALEQVAPEQPASRARTAAEFAPGRRQLRGAQRRDATNSILSADAFERCSERERCRADRAARRFSLVVLHPREVERTAFAEFAHQLRKRLRSTDLVGQVGVESLGVLLTDTESKGAQVVIAWAKQAELRFGLHLQSSICVYPAATESEPSGDRPGQVQTDRAAPEPLHGHAAQRKLARVEIQSPAHSVGSHTREF
jgi:GGDEF domain-containing protein